MDCNESQSLMAAYIDGELDSSSAVRYGAHLETCPACFAADRKMRDLQTAVRSHATQYVAPAHLRQRIQAALPRPAPSPRKFSKLPWTWVNFGVTGACSLAFAVMLSVYMQAPSLQDRLEDEVVASHARSMMVNHLSDVISTDQHTVKPWFSDKLDFSPTVVDFAQQGFPLIGGRLDYLDQRPVAAMIYRHRLHTLNLFVWPETPHNDTPPVSTSKQGYQLIHWTQSGMCYWLISDMNAQDLTEFKHLLSGEIDKGSRH